jgi:hypothetical protein
LLIALIKFWCAELGASKEKKTILKGQHSCEVLQKQLDRYVILNPLIYARHRFIEKYLLCGKCHYPETSMYLKQKNLHARCRACGHDQMLDSTHRAGSYLANELPKNMSEIDIQNAGGAAQDQTDGKKKSKKTKKDETKEEETETAPMEKKKKEETLD